MDEIYNGQKLGEVLLTPTKIYVKPILSVLEKFNVKGMAHITGGGFIENIPRMLPKGLTAVINKNSYPIPEIYERFLSLGITEDELFNTFNMGIGFVLCVDKSIKEQVIKYLISLGERAYDIGFITSGDERICVK